MRLIGFGAGEALDRLSILSLKIVHADLRGVRSDHFAEEEQNLLVWLDQHPSTISDATHQEVRKSENRLAAVNAVIWYAEDELRRLRSVDSPVEQGAIANMAVKLQIMNDHRAELIREINLLTGYEGGEEKIT